MLLILITNGLLFMCFDSCWLLLVGVGCCWLMLVVIGLMCMCCVYVGWFVVGCCWLLLVDADDNWLDVDVVLVIVGYLWVVVGCCRLILMIIGWVFMFVFDYG